MAYSLLRILRGKFREVTWFVYLLTALFFLRFLYVAHGS
jgi:xanthine/uracil/vitamin C permease (AzgA family)